MVKLQYHSVTDPRALYHHTPISKRILKSCHNKQSNKISNLTGLAISVNDDEAYEMLNDLDEKHSNIES